MTSKINRGCDCNLQVLYSILIYLDIYLLPLYLSVNASSSAGSDLVSLCFHTLSEDNGRLW